MLTLSIIVDVLAQQPTTEQSRQCKWANILDAAKKINAAGFISCSSFKDIPPAQHVFNLGIRIALDYAGYVPFSFHQPNAQK